MGLRLLLGLVDGIQLNKSRAFKAIFGGEIFMNFLEQLIAEWYAFNGYFVRTNVKFGKREKGGYKGEMDVVAYHPSTKVLTHVEASTDANTWEERKTAIDRKFGDAAHFTELFDFDIKGIKRIAIFGFSKPKNPVKFKDDIELLTIPQFVESITEELSKRSPQSAVVPENYPLLRAIQLAAYYGISRRTR